MLEILLLGLVAIATMAKARPRRRRWTADMQAVPYTEAFSLGTLASVTVITGTVLPASDNEYRCLSISTLWSLRNHTGSEGPIIVGYAHGDYSVTEIKQCIEAEGSMTRGDKIAAEQADRLVRRVGVFAGTTAEDTLNDGKPIRTRLNWVIPDGKTLTAWAYIQSGAALTTGSNVVLNGKTTIRWI